MPDPTHLIQEMLTETQVPVPKKLAEALDAYNAATSEVVAPIDVDLAVLDIKAADVPELIAEVARRRALNPAAILKSAAFINVRDGLGRRVVREFAASSGAVFTAYGERFNVAAELLTVAAPQLPQVLELERAANGSPEGLAAWAVARDAATTMTNYRGRRNWLGDFGLRANGIPGNLDRASRFAMFEDRDAIGPILNAEKVTPFDQWVSIARTPGVTLHWSTLEEQADLAARFAAEDAARVEQEAREGEAATEALADAWLRPLGADAA